MAPIHDEIVARRSERESGLLDEKLDDIFFTGSVEVGKTVMKAASKHPTPVTLELRGAKALAS